MHAHSHIQNTQIIQQPVPKTFGAEIEISGSLKKNYIFTQINNL